MGIRRLNISMNRVFLLFICVFFFFCANAPAQKGPQNKEQNISGIVKDSRESLLEGYIGTRPDDLTMFSKDDKEQKILSKYLQSITLEKIAEAGPLHLDPKQEARYSVRLENSREIFTLQKKYTFSLNTNVGVVTRSLDLENINHVKEKDLPSLSKPNAAEEGPFIQDKSIFFSLEFKF